MLGPSHDLFPGPNKVSKVSVTVTLAFSNSIPFCSMPGVKIQIKGTVQGVGFRPFVYKLARRCHLKGYVLNDTDGVKVEAEGQKSDLDEFLLLIENSAPPSSRIETIIVEKSAPQGFRDFQIKESVEQNIRTVLVSPDLATCEDCIGELFDPEDRRFGYPFLNCTNCGPRLTIIRDVPYDRDLTTMSAFSMCERCGREYRDPEDRRFHAQPTACPECGPSLTLVQGAEERIASSDPISDTIELLRKGKIVAVKGLGGYHLACDATNQEAVSTLRKRKYREDKPFALMAADLATIEKFCHVSKRERELLESVKRPIVLLAVKDAKFVAGDVAPHQRYLGVMLPYTPLHHLLLKRSGLVLVMTSGNLSDEPIAYQDQEALGRLRTITDCFLTHNREIYRRCDDSVSRVWNDKEMILRRARGYVPAPIKLDRKFEKHVLACGGELKNTFCLCRENYAFPSSHIGDLENLETLNFFEREIERFKRICHVEPEIVAYDMHPGYLSTRYALSCSQETKVAVQHHHAHIAACMAENHIHDEVIGVALDGTGYGEDGAVWGGEFLLTTAADYRRAAHLKYVLMPGGETAIRQPWRMALSYLYRCFEEDFGELDIDFVRRIDPADWDVLKKMLAYNLNTLPTSSMGRLFDAVSVLLEYRQRTNYEGQPAIELEMMADEHQEECYDFDMEALPGGIVIDPDPMIREIVDDIVHRVPNPAIAGKFHNTISQIIGSVCGKLREEYHIKDVCLSGGVFQNTLLLRKTRDILIKNGFEVHTHSQVPPNDGGISLGQAVVANERLLKQGIG
jgi:hydrogenase maturation protein HypF